MSDTSTDYLITETTKKLGSVIEQLESITDDFKEVNIEKLVEKMPDHLPKLHEILQQLDKNLASTKLISLVYSLMSKDADVSDSNES